MRLARFLLPSLLVAFAPCLCATPPAPTPPVEPDIVLPGLDPVPPAPTPQPTPAITKLSAAELYVIEGKVPLLVLASPEGIVSVTEEAGPVKVRAIFAGNTKYSTRNVKGPSVYFVEATGTGRVELLIARKDGTGKVIRRTLDVNGGPAPTPDPPGPKPPDPKPPGPVTSFHVVWVYESGDTLTQAQNSVLYAKSVSDYLNTATTKDGTTVGWRRYDKDVDVTNESPTMKALWAAVKPQLTAVPCVVVEVNGKADILPMPDTPADAVALFKKYTGGK